MNRIPSSSGLLAMAAFLLVNSALAQQTRTFETPPLSYVISQDAVGQNLSDAMKGSYEAVEKVMARSKVYRDEEFWSKTYGDTWGRRLPDVVQREDSATGLRGWIHEGPLFYLSTAQKNWYSNVSGARVAVPDFMIENMASVWTGICSGNSVVTDQIGVDTPAPKEFLSFFDQVVEGAMSESTDSGVIWNPGGFSSKKKGFLLGGTWAERLISATTLGKVNSSSFEDPLKDFHPKSHVEVYLSNIDNLVSDIYFFGRLRGPMPLSPGSLVAYGATTYGEAKLAQIVIYPSGGFVVYLPCVSLRQTINRPLVLQFRADSSVSYLIPLRIADSSRFPENMRPILAPYPDVVRTGLRPSTWRAQEWIFSNDSSKLAELLGEYSSYLKAAMKPIAFGEIPEQNSWVQGSVATEVKFRSEDPGFRFFLERFDGY